MLFVKSNLNPILKNVAADDKINPIFDEIKDTLPKKITVGSIYKPLTQIAEAD